jgi:(1->4)-alpha-D-glucan 1-alpha-D-glucosylmutase
VNRVVSTYRLQLRGPASGQPFTFADAEDLLDYLDDLGVTHVYLSPVLTAVHGSTHGYDVTDPTRVFDELGGSEGLAELSANARSRGMGLVVDIVPNHLGIDAPAQNPWWWDVLRHGRESAYAEFFDIDWGSDNGVDGKLALPVLGSDDDVDDLTVDGDLLRRWPVCGRRTVASSTPATSKCVAGAAKDSSTAYGWTTPTGSRTPPDT